MAAGNNHIDRGCSPYIPFYTRKAVFTQNNICNEFAGSGLKPLNKDRVLEKITLQLHTPTPPPLAEGSISSVC